MPHSLLEPFALPQLHEIVDLCSAFLLSALIGMERERRRKSAGLRVTTLVGVSAALFMIVSKVGFDDVLASGRVVLDPSRIAAQIVSGIGFIGGGVIFMRRDVVRGLTTAASIWVTAAIGMACGASLVLLAGFVTLLHFIIVLGLPRAAERLRGKPRQSSRLRIVYADGRGLLRDILLCCSTLHFTISRVEIEKDSAEEVQDLADLKGCAPEAAPHRAVALTLQVKGRAAIGDLIARLAAIDGVEEAAITDEEEPE